ncbi:Tex-like N-terminal domain-containing protein, partial [Rothia sp. HMSC071F11]
MSEKHERTEATNTRILTMLSNELDLKPTRVRAAVNLLDSGSSVPFIARYRKEATGALTD